MFHAVIVGVSLYADEKIRDLSFAGADADAVAALLDARVDGPRRILTLRDERATKANVERVLTEELPVHVHEGDDVLVYFAGHGSPDVDVSCGDPSIHALLHDTDYAHLTSTSLNVVSELAVWLRRLKAQHIAVVIDASFNGAAGGRTMEGPGLWSGPPTRRLDRVSLNGLAFGTQGAILTACGEKEAANEAPAYQHGVFTYHLLELLEHAPAGALSIAAIYDAVSAAVRQATEGTQNPALHATRASVPLLCLRERDATRAGAG